MQSQKTSSFKSIFFLTQFALLLGIEAIVCFTPLGSLPIGPLVATLSHIPVIVTAILLGTGSGAAMGFFFGLFSFIVWTFTPPGPAAFVFTPFYSIGDISGNAWSLVICFVPRILIGVVTGLCTAAFRRALPNRKWLTYGMVGILGSLTNTFLVLGGIYIFFGRPYAEAYGLTYELLLGAMGTVILTNGLLEAGLAALTGSAICRPVEKALHKLYRL